MNLKAYTQLIKAILSDEPLTVEHIKLAIEVSESMDTRQDFIECIAGANPERISTNSYIRDLSRELLDDYLKS